MDKELFRSHVTERISHLPDLSYEWSDDEDHCEIIIHGSPQNGFDVHFGYNGSGYYMDTSIGFHEHFDFYDEEEESPYEVFLRAFKFVRDILSPKVRIREILAGSKPRTWILEYNEDGEWIRNRISSSLFWNYFAPKTEKYYSNKMLQD
jgi:hypothetical protein